MPIEVGIPKTVGELRALIANLPDDMPVHHRRDMGSHPVGLPLLIRKLAPAKNEPTDFADVEVDEVWSKPEKRGSFGKAIDALCSL